MVTVGAAAAAAAAESSAIVPQTSLSDSDCFVYYCIGKLIRLVEIPVTLRTH